MATNSQNRDLLVRQLAWQQEMGIDEILLDVPAPNDAVPLSALAGVSRRQTPAPSGGLAENSPDTPPETPPEQRADRRAIVSPARSDKSADPATVAPQDESSATQPNPHAAPAPALAAINTLEELRNCLAALEGCALRNTAANMVFADGNAGARLMVIGDVPGRDEDRVGLPLVGPEGQLFDRMLASIGLSRADCYIAPLIPWRPPGNRTPTDEEMDLLLPWLRRHVQLAAPDMLLLLGGVPAKALLPAGGGILKLRGRWHDIDYGDGVPRQTLATLHPAYLLRSPPQKRLAFADLLALAGKLG